MTVRWGILGVGDVVRKRVAEAIRSHPQSQLLAGCRRDIAKLAEFCAAFAVPRSYQRDVDLLADPDIDAVYIATPVNLHLPQTLAAIAAGKHVLVEKPMALSSAECRQMIDRAAAADVRLGVAYYRRFYPLVHRLRELLQAGAIGRPIAATVVTGIPFAFRPGDDGHWRVVPEQGGGGPLMDIGSHRLNLLISLFGPPERVAAQCSTVAGDFPVEDCATLALRFAGGVQASLTTIFGTPVDPDEFSVLGTAGRLAASPLNGDRLTIDTPDGRREEIHPPAANFNAPLIADFVAAIQNHTHPTVDGEEGLLTTAAIERAYQSAQESTS